MQFYIVLILRLIQGKWRLSNMTIKLIHMTNNTNIAVARTKAEFFLAIKCWLIVYKCTKEFQYFIVATLKNSNPWASGHKLYNKAKSARINLNIVNILHSSPKQEATLHFAAVQDPAKESLQIAYSWMDRKTESPSPVHCMGGLSRTQDRG